MRRTFFGQQRLDKCTIKILHLPYYQHPTLGYRHFLRAAACYLRSRKSKLLDPPGAGGVRSCTRDHLAHPDSGSLSNL